MCHNKYIEVTVENKNYPGLDTNVTHLEDVSCVPGYRDEDKVVFKFGLEDCKTEQEVDEDNIYYKNKVIAIVKDEVEDSEITRSNTKVLPFQCAYKKQALLSKVQFTPKSIMIVSDAGKRDNSMELLVSLVRLVWWSSNAPPNFTIVAVIFAKIQ